MVVVRGLRLTRAGIGVGLAAAFESARLATAFLYGVQPHDPLVFAVVPLFLTGIAWVAAWRPARYAGRVNPVEVLRRV